MFLLIGRGLIEVVARIPFIVSNPNVEEIYFIGFAESLVDELDFADINIPKLVLPWEHISERLVNASEAISKASKELFEKIFETSKKVCKKFNKKVKSLNNVTIDSIYNESIKLLTYFRELGCGTIDMELSAIYRYTNYFNKKVIGILSISDRPLHKETYYEEKYLKKKELLKSVKKEILFEIAKRIVES